MKKQLLLLSLIIPFFALTQNLKVIDVKEAKSLNISDKYVNANGEVLITEDYYQALKNGEQTLLDPGEIEGFPVLGLAGTTQRASRFADIDLDGEKEIIFFTGSLIQVYKPDGTVKEGWPVFTGNDPLQGAPSIGNIDDDPELEIIAHISFYNIRGELHAYDSDGTIKSGFPIIWPDGGPQKEPLLENIDEDPEMEIISARYNWPTAFVTAYNGDGALDPFWENIELDYIPGSGCSSGDLDGDGVPEIIACSFWKLYAFNIKAELLDGFPFTYEQDVRNVSYSNPVIADIDEDGFNDIVVGTCNSEPQTDAGAVYVIKNNGTVLNGWPQFVTRWLYAPVSVVDLDQDSHLDIIVGDQVLSPTPDDYLHAWDKDGNNLQGFPVGSLEAINVQAMVGDFDGFPEFEIIVDNNVTGGPYQIFEHDGTEFTFFTLNPQGATFFNSALLADINSDGNLNIIAPTVHFDNFTTDMHIYDIEIPFNADLMPLWTHQYNSRNTGEYGLFDPVTKVNEPVDPDACLISVYPNPFNTSIRIDCPKNLHGNFVFQLYNSAGNQILNSSMTFSSEIQFSLPFDLQKGIYYYVIEHNTDSESGKLIKN
jgi:hypothetical protein